MMRGMSSAETPLFVKDIWRGIGDPGHVLFIPAGCCVGVKVLRNQPAVALRKHVLPVTATGLEDLNAVAAIAPTRVSGQFCDRMKEALGAS